MSCLGSACICSLDRWFWHNVAVSWLAAPAYSSYRRLVCVSQIAAVDSKPSPSPSTAAGTETAKNLISSSALLASFGDSDAESYEHEKEKALLSEVERHPRTQNSELDSFPLGEKSVAKIFEATYLFITIHYYHLTIGSISVPHQKRNQKGINFIKDAVLIIYFFVSQTKNLY